MLSGKWGYTIVLFVVMLSLSIVGCQQYIEHNKKEARMQPKLNPHPKHFIRLYGHVDKQIKVTLLVNYYSYLPKCQVVVDWAEGAYSPRVVSIKRVIHPTASGRYSVLMPLDVYQPGYCRWKVVEVAALLTDKSLPKMKSYYYIVSGLDLKNKNAVGKNTRLNVPCYIVKDFITKKHEFGCDSVPGYPTRNSKQLEINFNMEKGAI